MLATLARTYLLTLTPLLLENSDSGRNDHETEPREAHKRRARDQTSTPMERSSCEGKLVADPPADLVVVERDEACVRDGLSEVLPNGVADGAELAVGLGQHRERPTVDRNVLSRHQEVQAEEASGECLDIGRRGGQRKVRCFVGESEHKHAGEELGSTHCVSTHTV